MPLTRIQVTEETCHILQTFGYTFEQRGLVAVKGKGQLMTYYLQSRAAMAHTSPNRAAAASAAAAAAGTAGCLQLETLTEVDDESRDNSSVGQPDSPPSRLLKPTGSRRSQSVALSTPSSPLLEHSAEEEPYE